MGGLIMASNIQNIHISEVENYIPYNSALICCASFESRCGSLPNVIFSKIKASIIYRNISVNIPFSTANLDIMRSKLPNSIVSEVPFDYPEIVADSMAKTIEMLAEKNKNLLIDTTTFTHETLLLLLRIIHSFKSSFEKILCLYVGAGEYSPGYTPENTWLSKGCRDVRNIIGFPGIMKPIAKTNLILLAGFELERATKLIELIEPDSLVLGNGIDPINDKISHTMLYFRDKYTTWKEDYKIIEKNDFEFSCRDIEKTVSTLSSIIAKAPEDNYIIVPLNTKLSTISAAIVALENKSIQLCYAVPEVYNYENYSSPGESVTVVDLKSFSVFQ